MARKGRHCDRCGAGDAPLKLYHVGGTHFKQGYSEWRCEACHEEITRPRADDTGVALGCALAGILLLALFGGILELCGFR